MDSHLPRRPLASAASPGHAPLLTSVEAWLRLHGGIAHRSALTLDRISTRRIADSGVVRVGRDWVALPSAPTALVQAARAGGRLACISAAEHIGLQVLVKGAQLHVALDPHYGATPGPETRVHRSRPMSPRGRHELVESVPDMLAHVAGCIPYEQALIVWESALRRRLLTTSELRRNPWRTRVARVLAEEAGPLSDSLLETLLAHALRNAGLPFVQQPKLLGHRVDFLIAGSVVAQVDGYDFHSDAVQRRLDIEHDARLRLAGFESVRFDFVQVVNGMTTVIETVGRLVATATVPDLMRSY